MVRWCFVVHTLGDLLEYLESLNYENLLKMDIFEKTPFPKNLFSDPYHSGLRSIADSP